MHIYHASGIRSGPIACLFVIPRSYECVLTRDFLALLDDFAKRTGELETPTTGSQCSGMIAPSSQSRRGTNDSPSWLALAGFAVVKRQS